MNYATIYSELMTRAQARPVSGYVERHHIIPRCLGGSDESENIASLTPREHFLAHLLLVKMHPGHNGLSYGAHMMSRKGLLGRSRDYAWLKERVVADQRRRQVGKSRPLSATAGLRVVRPKTAEHRAKLAAANRGKKLSAETRGKLSALRLGQKFPEQRVVNSAKAHATLPDATVREIRARFDAGERVSALCQEFGVARSHGYRIAKRVAYRWVA